MAKSTMGILTTKLCMNWIWMEWR